MQAAARAGTLVSPYLVPVLSRLEQAVCLYTKEEIYRSTKLRNRPDPRNSHVRSAGAEAVPLLRGTSQRARATGFATRHCLR